MVEGEEWMGVGRSRQRDSLTREELPGHLPPQPLCLSRCSISAKPAAPCLCPPDYSAGPKSSSALVLCRLLPGRGQGVRAGLVAAGDRG